jgi:Arc/MetJ-type ribon-helix-helix transcriptional regulator
MPRPKTPEETHCQKMSVSFTPEQLEQVIDYCQRNERSISWVIRKALEKWLEEHKNDSL